MVRFRYPLPRRRGARWTCEQGSWVRVYIWIV